MNLSVLHPIPTFQTSHPVKVSPRGNMYKINVSHFDQTGNTVRNVEVWATKEAVQKHFGNRIGDPHNYELKKFARQTYENQLRKHEGHMPNKGMLVTTDTVRHGDPKLWPHTLAHSEIKL